MAKKTKKPRFELSKGMFWIFGTLILLVLIFVASYYVFSGLGEVEYKGLVFTIEKFGNAPYIIFYKYIYHFSDDEGNIINYNLRVRINPAKNDFPIRDEIVLPRDKKMYLSINTTGIDSCNQSMIAIVGLSSFLADNLFYPMVGTPDENQANETNLPWVQCGEPDATVISIFAGDKNEIRREGDCYKIEFTDCDVLKAVEKFEVQSVLDAKKRAG